MHNPPMTRRFFQFSLAGILVFVAAICVFLAVRTNRQHNRRVAIAKIEKLGGEIAFASDWHPVNSFFLNVSRNPVVPKSSPFARLWGDDPSTCVVQVYFSRGGRVTDAHLASLLPLGEIQELAIGDNPITDAGLMKLVSLPNLEWIDLRLGNTKVTEDGIARFRKALPNCVVWR
jgi:hypothetical protein